ncbi:hypothetical protein SAMN05216302_10036 [Nitrosomonas aestuarii]|uniref:Uncharacterized protein n=1 Tax=Nitrosomonas aestuarii TaxID=52441 RepID=A0A1I3Y323_9PROT|nr:hypothetical protein [Nitrosomonas aestuarii]SFK26337.1 hypothetical protein SAMN05216302_10036 [Nitrosomonas aestuarii]
MAAKTAEEYLLSDVNGCRAYIISEAGRYIGKAIYTLSGLIPEEKKELPGL